MHWVHNDAWHYLCSMPSLGVTMSYFWGEREQTAWKVWMAFNDVTEAFCGSKIQDILLSFCAYNLQQINLLQSMSRLIFQKDSLYCYRTEQVMNIQWTKLANNCSPKNSNNRWTSPNKGSTDWACQESCVPSWSCLGTDAGCRPWASIPM